MPIDLPFTCSDLRKFKCLIMSHHTECAHGEEGLSNVTYPFTDNPLVPAEERDHTICMTWSTFPSLDDRVSNQMFMITCNT